MRFLEVVLLLLGGILPIVLSSKKVNINTELCELLVIGVFIGHLTFEGIRWQMSPVYLILFLILVCLAKGYAYFEGNWFRQITSGFFLCLLLGLGCSLSTILPVFEFSTPTGGFRVGAQVLHFVTDEEEVITNEIEDKRALMIKVWYPANIINEVPEKYLDAGERIGLSTKYGLPNSTFNYLDLIKTNTYTHPNVVEGQFPILIFSPGYYSNATGYTALIEEIASHGYIVFNINHTYESVGTLFPNGQIKLYDQAYDRIHNNEAMAEMIWTAMENYKKATSKEAKNKTIKGLLKNYVAADITDRWAKDIALVVHQLPEWKKSTFLSNHLDTTKIGVFGHSQGGAAAGQALLDNPKITAGINIDGAQWGTMADTFQSKPFMLLASDWPDSHPDFNALAYQHGSTNDFYKAKLKNSGHSSFMDIPFMVNLPFLNEAGTIEPKKAIRFTSTTVILFFNKYFAQETIDLEIMAEQYPDLEIEKIPE